MGLINVKTYGAVGDGVADDTAAVQSAVNALTGSRRLLGSLYFPAGSYRVAGLTFDRGVSVCVVGEGSLEADAAVGAAIVGRSTRSTLVYNGSRNGALVTMDGSFKMRFENLGLATGPAGLHDAAALVSIIPRPGWGAGTIVFDNVSFTGAAAVTSAVQCGTASADINCDSLRFYSCSFVNVLNALHVLNDQGLQYWFYGCTGLTINTFARFDHGGSFAMFGGGFTGCRTLLSIGPGAGDVNGANFMLSNVRCEETDGADFYFVNADTSNAANIVVQNCLVTTSANTSTDGVIKVSGRSSVTAIGNTINDRYLATLTGGAHLVAINNHSKTSQTPVTIFADSFSFYEATGNGDVQHTEKLPQESNIPGNAGYDPFWQLLAPLGPSLYLPLNEQHGSTALERSMAANPGNSHWFKLSGTGYRRGIVPDTSSSDKALYVSHNAYVNLLSYVGADDLSGNFSAGAWVKADAVNTPQCIMDSIGSNTGFGIWIGDCSTAAGDGKPTFALYGSDRMRYKVRATSSLSTNWHFVVATKDASNNLKLYIDGVPSSQPATTNGGQNGSGAGFRLGASPWYGSYSLSGYLKKAFSIKAALTPAQIQALYAAGKY